MRDLFVTLITQMGKLRGQHRLGSVVLVQQFDPPIGVIASLMTLIGCESRNMLLSATTESIIMTSTCKGHILMVRGIGVNSQIKTLDRTNHTVN